MPKVKNSSVKTNIFLNAFLTISSLLFPLITFPYASRVLLPIGTGKVAFATSFINYFVMISQLGIPTYGIRKCAQFRDDRKELTRIAHELLIINFVMSILSYACLVITLLSFEKFRTDRELYFIISSTILLSAIGMEWLYKALEQYKYITIRSLVCKIIALVSLFLLVKTKSDYVLYGAISIFAASASNICNFINVRKYIDIKPVGGYNFRRHLKPVLVFFAMSCAATIYTNLDTVMLGFMTTDIDVGYYNAAVKIKNIMTGIVTSIGAVLLPRASYYLENNQKEDFHRITNKSLNLVVILAFPLMVFFIFFANEGILFLSGDAYIRAVPAMQFIMPTVLFIGMSNVLGIQMLVPMGKEKIVLYSEIAGAVVDVIINLILIPIMAAAGASIGTTVAELVVLLVQYLMLKEVINKYIKQIQFHKVIISTAISFLFAFWIKWLQLNPFFVLAGSGILFFGSFACSLLCMKERITIEFFNQLLAVVQRRKINNCSVNKE